MIAPEQDGTSEGTADIDLMEMTKAGDERAFSLLVERHQFRVIGTVAKMLGNESDAEDIAQQVFVRVWQSRARYSPTAKFTTWLMTITRNLVFNEMRRRKRAHFIPIDRDDENGHPVREQVDPGARPAAEALQESELQEAIASAISALPEAQRMAVILRRYEEMPYEEIARVLGSSVPAVKSLLFRARSDLKEKLKAHLPG